jgi:exonuclease SbcD
VRIAHLADVHLGFRQFQRLSGDGLNQREADVAVQFRRAVDAMIAREPDCVVVAGDLFHSVRPSNRSIIEAFTGFQRLRAALPGSPVVLIAGNHDTPRSTESGSILQLMASLGVDVVDERTTALKYPGPGLGVLAVPHISLVAGERQFTPVPGCRVNVLVCHPEVAGYFPESGESDFGGVRLERSALEGDWHYVALGHYHVASEVAPRVWYSGSLEYTSPNIWGESFLEERRGLTKGLLIADTASGEVERVALPPARRIHDLPWLDAAGMSARELDLAIEGRLAGIAGGIADTVTRLVVENVPRELAHALDHAVQRRLRAEALHFNLDLRRPAPAGRTPLLQGRRRTLTDIVTDYLGRRPLDAELDRARLVELGRAHLEALEQTGAGTAA